MRNKKLILILGTTILSGAVIAGTMLGINSSESQKILGTGDDVWNHYEAVSPTLDKKGIKEYWVNCETHQSVFVEPASEHIVDMGTPSDSFINSLENDDPRLLNRYLRGFDFDDGVNPYITIKSGFETLTVVDGEGVGGSKALVATRSSAGDSFLRIDKSYLDAVFANPSVKSLAFEAKAHNATNNFRHITVDKSFVNNNSDIVSCFERNSAGWGVDTNWKTFYLTRGVYSQINMNDGNLDWFLKFGAGSLLPQALYLDNFRICTTDYFDYTQYGFENGYFTGSELKDPAVNQKGFSVGSATNQGFDYDVKTEGERSFTLTKVSGENPFYLGVGMRSLLGADDYLVFDFYGTTALNNTNEGIRDGTRTALACLTSAFAANKWQTIVVPKSGITSDGRFLIIGTSVTGTYWIDNLRISHGAFSFENKPYTSLFGSYANTSFYNIPDATAGDYLRDHGKDYLVIAEWGGWNKIEISEEKASEGAYSLKLTTTQGEKPLRVVPMWVDRMDDDSIFSFDIYSDDMTFSGPLESVEQGEWTTVSFTKADFAAVNNYRVISGGFTKGTMYLDNFRLVL